MTTVAIVVSRIVYLRARERSGLLTKRSRRDKQCTIARKSRSKDSEDGGGFVFNVSSDWSLRQDSNYKFHGSANCTRKTAHKAARFTSVANKNVPNKLVSLDRLMSVWNAMASQYTVRAAGENPMRNGRLRLFYLKLRSAFQMFP